MMRVPRSARPSTMFVKVPREGGYGGEFEQPVEVRRVRFEPVSAWLVRILALGCSLLAGVVTGFVGGVPADPGAWVTCAFAVVGGVQAAYTLFKSVGITSKWLDALLGVTVDGKE